MRGQLSVESRQRQVIARLKNKNKRLQEDNEFLKDKVNILENQVENMGLQIEELQTIIFSKKRNKDHNDPFNLSPKQPRTKESFRRTIPNDNEITDKETLFIDNCPDCGNVLIKKKTVVRYVEDITLPHLNILTGLICSPNKKVLKQTYEKGYCPKCKCWHTAKKGGNSPPITNREVILGNGIKKYICYKTYILRLTYQQIQDELKDLYNIKISDGEIANILNETSQNKLKVPYEQLLKRIQKSSANHLDETGWLTKGERTFAWVMTPTKSEESVFMVGKSRGKGIAENLLGENWHNVRITDCYGAYKNLKGDHQVCWAHMLRKARDLSQNQTLTEDKRKFANNIYFKLQTIYHELKIELQQGVDKQKAIPMFKIKTRNIIKTIQESTDAPKKLLDLSKLMNKYLDELFVCLKYDNVPADNNKAEQKLRHLVLKRKNSFGAKTDKGNETFSINASVMLSLWWNGRLNFWNKFNELMA